MATPDQLQLNDSALHPRLDTLLRAPAELLLPERLLLYALVRGLRPVRCLEIGTHFGGSTTIIAAALDDAGAGTLICIDPHPLVPSGVWDTVSHRATMIAKPSPAAVDDALERAGGRFDFVFIDGDHSLAGVVRDVEAVIQAAASGAHLLFHDSHYWEVAAAIDSCLTRFAGSLVDCGTLSTLSTAPITGADGSTARWGGLRMLRTTAERL
jgi:hypothetical protein